MNCLKCGTPVSSDAKYCESCGTALPSEAGFNADPRSVAATEGPDAGQYQSAGNSAGAPEDESKSFWDRIYHPWSRYFARSIDIYSTVMICALLFYICTNHFPHIYTKENVSSGYSVVVVLIVLLSWMPVEAAFLSLMGTTPAKWVFGITVLNKEGNKLSFSQALKRAVIVWIKGLGLGIPIITIVTQLFAYYRLVKGGSTSWDVAVNSAVSHKNWLFVRIITSFIFALLAILLIAVLIYLFFYSSK